MCSFRVLDDDEKVVTVGRHHDLVLFRTHAQKGQVVLRIQITDATPRLCRQLEECVKEMSERVGERVLRMLE